ncbi:MAG TPA: response regulator [Persephonella sp.]|uniref:Putative response regulator receiver protein n=1 Tax=Persephonella marina (strain DSM 14350 / EX-H1) TaxID=123214 RepID=C0QPQ8_PERMH|nr:MULTISPECIES: response regulator [Persephonella]ACO03381.1 putative response regulator receiver protein [Persephonella marina EX-H1]HCB69731.1 response regulator [Persephonella sp.]
MKILLLDDDVETYRVLQDVAQFSNSKVIQVRSIQEAKEILSSERDIDGIVAEIRLNGQPTWEILSFMRKNEDIKELPFIVLSSPLSDEEKEFFEHMKVTAILEKPFNPLEVFTEILEHLKKVKGEEYIRERLEEEEVDRSLLKSIIQKIINALKNIFKKK